MKQFGVFIRYLWLCGCAWLGCMTLLTAPRTERASDTENRMLAGAPTPTVESVLDGSFMSGVEDWLADGVVLRDRWIGVSHAVERALAMPVDEETEAAQMMAAIEAETGEEAKPLPSEQTSEQPTPEPEQTETKAETTTERTETQEPTHQVPTATENPEEDAQIHETTFWIRYKDGTVRDVYAFPVQNVRNAAAILNEYRSLLPEDGSVIFAEVPIAATGNAYLGERNIRECWGSDMEEQLQKIVDEGVYIINASAAIEPALQRGEYVYFRTDHHWTALGAHYIYQAMMERLGIPPMAYHDYAYTINRGMGGGGPRSDTIEVIHEILPTHSYIVRRLKYHEEIRYMYPERKDYTAYISGTRTPWRQFDSGFQTGRTALLIGDSFSNALLPYLLPHYDRIMMTDLRGTYYRPEDAGGSVQKYIQTYDVDDIYFMFCFATSVNSDFFINGQMTRYLYW